MQNSCEYLLFLYMQTRVCFNPQMGIQTCTRVSENAA